MKAGIMTFHWATNYGAVLQAYSLQEALKELGMDVEIIDYKPKQYDDNLWTFIRFRKFLRLREYIQSRSKESKLTGFRRKYMNLSGRYTSLSQLKGDSDGFDILITGSDQVLNPSFLCHGENGGSTAYFLDFGNVKAVRMAYAASFGTTYYPADLIEKTKPHIGRFDYVSSRESTGCDIFKEMGAPDPEAVPDPTLLHTSEFYDRLLKSESPVDKRVRVYFLRGEEANISKALALLDGEMIKDESIEQWLNAIRSSSHFITNSFHGVVFCLIYHIPFTVVLKTVENKGMNDRFYTLLQPLSLTDRLVSKDDFDEKSIECQFDWDLIDCHVDSLRKTGYKFLEQLNNK